MLSRENFGEGDLALNQERIVTQLKQLYNQIDTTLCSLDNNSGSTAVVAVIHVPSRRLIVLNVGDSILFSEIHDECGAYQCLMTTAHEGVSQVEVDGIIEKISLGRAFGDKRHKQEQKLSSEPDIQISELPEEIYLLLASDGIKLVHLMRAELSSLGQEPAKKIVANAINTGSRDNCSAIYVDGKLLFHSDISGLPQDGIKVVPCVQYINDQLFKKFMGIDSEWSYLGDSILSDPLFSSFKKLDVVSFFEHKILCFLGSDGKVVRCFWRGIRDEIPEKSFNSLQDIKNIFLSRGKSADVLACNFKLSMRFSKAELESFFNYKSACGVASAGAGVGAHTGAGAGNDADVVSGVASAGAGAGVGAGADTGARAGVGAHTGVDAGNDADVVSGGVGSGVGAGADTGAGAGVGAHTGVDAGNDADVVSGGVGSGVGAGADTGAGAGVGAHTGAGASVGSDVGFGAGDAVGHHLAGAGTGAGAGADTGARAGVGAHTGAGWSPPHSFTSRRTEVLDSPLSIRNEFQDIDLSRLRFDDDPRWIHRLEKYKTGSLFSNLLTIYYSKKRVNGLENLVFKIIVKKQLRKGIVKPESEIHFLNTQWEAYFPLIKDQLSMTWPQDLLDEVERVWFALPDSIGWRSSSIGVIKGTTSYSNTVASPPLRAEVFDSPLSIRNEFQDIDLSRLEFDKDPRWIHRLEKYKTGSLFSNLLTIYYSKKRVNGLENLDFKIIVKKQLRKRVAERESQIHSLNTEWKGYFSLTKDQLSITWPQDLLDEVERVWSALPDSIHWRSSSIGVTNGTTSYSHT